MSVGGVVSSVYQTRENQKNLKSTIEKSDVVTVQRRPTKPNDGLTEVLSLSISYHLIGDVSTDSTQVRFSGIRFDGKSVKWNDMVHKMALFYLGIVENLRLI